MSYAFLTEHIWLSIMETRGFSLRILLSGDLMIPALGGLEVSMNQSILDDIKKMLGLEICYQVFDPDVIALINSALMVLQQIGVVPKEGFMIDSSAQLWSDFVPDDKLLGSIKTYVYLKVKVVFDPPVNSYVMDAYNKTAEELEWRLREQIESYPGDLPRQEEETEEESEG